MANEAATAKDSDFLLISMVPDVCFTPKKPPHGVPVPYPIMHKMDKSKQCSPNVFFRGKPAYLHEESYVDKVTGDEPGMGKGVVSGTNTKISRSQQHSKSVFINGRALVRTGDMVHMNRSGPGGGGVTIMARDKRARWDCRKGQIAAAKETLQGMPEGAEKERLQTATERFERNNVEVERAKLAQHVYQYDKDPYKNSDPPIIPEPPEGWIAVSDADGLAQYGLEPDNLHKPPSNFRAQVYEPDPAVFGNDLKPTVAFKGTQMTELEDWKNNFAQGGNFHSSYYENAVTIGKNIRQSGAQVHIVGHSLGGGTASAASRASGMPATTFNSAGLNSKTVARYGGTVHQTAIQAYRIKGEILTGLQEPGWGGTALAAGAGFAIGGIKGAAIGALARVGLAALMPDAVGTPHELEGKGKDPIDLHGMDQVIDSIERQKTEDQKIIASATGKTCP